MNTLKYNKNNNIYNTNNNIFYMNTLNYNKNNNIYNTNNYIKKPINSFNTNNNIFVMNTLNYKKNNNIYNTTQDPRTLGILGPDAGSKSIGSFAGPHAIECCVKTLEKWVLTLDPRALDPSQDPNHLDPDPGLKSLGS